MKVRLSALGLFILLLFATRAGAAKPPQPNNDIPVTITFRCPGTECVATDRIAGDFYGPYGNDVTRYFLNSDGGHGALWMYLDLPRTIHLDFSEQEGIAPCLSTSTGCRRNFTVVDTETVNGDIAVNPTDANDVVLTNGFFSIPVGGSAYARVKINFPDPSGRAYQFTVRFNSGAYAGSTNVAVRRLSENEWEVEATADDRARLVSITTSRKAVTADEGLYVMPFKMRVVK